MQNSYVGCFSFKVDKLFGKFGKACSFILTNIFFVKQLVKQESNENLILGTLHDIDQETNSYSFAVSRKFFFRISKDCN